MVHGVVFFVIVKRTSHAFDQTKILSNDNCSNSYKNSSIIKTSHKNCSKPGWPTAAAGWPPARADGFDVGRDILSFFGGGFAIRYALGQAIGLRLRDGQEMRSGEKKENEAVSCVNDGNGG